VMGFFQDRVSRTVCPGLASNQDPPDLCLLRSWDYRCEPPVPRFPADTETFRVSLSPTVKCEQ
jgi:hypothetical protein